MLLGEFGVYKLVAPPASRVAWLGDVRRIAESLGWGWCLWEAHKGFGILDGTILETAAAVALLGPLPVHTTSTAPQPVMCALSLDWEAVIAAYVGGHKVHSGGLGEQTTATYGVWLCIEPALANCTTGAVLGAAIWPLADAAEAAAGAAAAAAAGANAGLLCFVYNEVLKRFEWWGLNTELALV